MNAWLKFQISVVLAASSPAGFAALDVGTAAPKFTAQVALAGVVKSFSLSDELAKGPVVLYFFPASFSMACSIEARNFAEAVDEFKSYGATVIGVSRDDIETQKKFSVSDCRGKFAVASDADQSIMKAYDAVLSLRPDYANRVSYVIAPDGKIVYQYTSLNPAKHVGNTLDVVKARFKQNAAQ